MTDQKKSDDYDIIILLKPFKGTELTKPDHQVKDSFVTLNYYNLTDFDCHILIQYCLFLERVIATKTANPFYAAAIHFPNGGTFIMGWIVCPCRSQQTNIVTCLRISSST